MLVTCQQMAEAEERLFSSGVSAEPYMDEAGRQCAEAIRQFFPELGRASVFCGKGNNGGDALVVARHLETWGWQVALHFIQSPDQRSPLSQKKLAEFDALDDQLPGHDGMPHVIIDGLLGIGASGDIRGAMREATDEINRLRNDEFATCFAIDIPTGLNADTGVAYEGAVRADFTLSITAAKRGFAADEAIGYVGRIVEIQLDIPIDEFDASIRFLFPSHLRPKLKRRNFYLHKGDAGRVAIIAGSKGFSGAAILTALGASRSGAGLVTVYVPDDIYPIVATKCPPEVMVARRSGIGAEKIDRADAIAIGPGIGTLHSRKKCEALYDLMVNEPAPIVIDADALTLLAKSPATLAQLPAHRLLTPHPGEMARLTNESGYRVQMTRKLADEWGVTLLHKGSRTAIASPGKPVELNAAGTPGMASGGMGDVLTGVCASLIAQGYSLHDAACLGSWLIGRAAECAIIEKNIAAESLNATQVAEHIGEAIKQLQTPGSY
ncbi:NAD(P)H-hydrate dehydratase [Verrucomicrobiales bacterium]|nr:NAD(P)H-hydrate dehydratase [Verrucomicrobiales bacterium]MDB4358931.1 NAD(P)H-hydrate dehydratase [Verrucomicrobiales bacterium]